ncbi:hypothetical protein AADG42_04315 [Ammonicoccus fulvus]|uniref:Uncharacterized protein n=1 Tax=Ammonicoccus fulvus TaxID=3138240 RepID=A0ABZ3FN72_9ACTN
MSPSTYGAIASVIGVLYLLALIGLGIFGALRTSGRTRALLLAGVGVLVVERLVGFLFPLLIGAIARSGNQMWTFQIIWNLFGTLLGLAGVALLILAAISAQTARAGFSSGGQSGSYPGGQPGGGGYPGGGAYPGGPQGPQGPQQPGPPGGSWQ